MAVLFAAYVSAAKLGIELSVARGVITPVWAPTGIALAALVLFGLRLWPAVALGAFVANVTSGAAPLDAAFIAVGNTLEAVVGGALLLRVGFRPAIDRVRDVFSLIVFGALLSTAIAATNGVTTLWVSGEISGSDYGSRWLLWWIGDGMGALIVAPLMFVLSTRPWRHLDLRDRLEGLVVLAALVALSATVFLGGQWRYPHLLFPVLIWATLRFQQFGAVTSSFVVAAFAVTGAVRGTALLGQGSTTEIVQILEGSPPASRSACSSSARCSPSAARLRDSSRRPTRTSPRPRKSRRWAAGNGTSARTESRGRTSSIACGASSRSRSR